MRLPQLTKVAAALVMAFALTGCLYKPHPDAFPTFTKYGAYYNEAFYYENWRYYGGAYRVNKHRFLEGGYYLNGKYYYKNKIFDEGVFYYKPSLNDGVYE